jgi:predicted nucleotidyltransferase component of viral defense system
MITRDELLTQAAAFDLNEADIQRDYVFGWIIGGIFRESDLASHAVLKGGNALRKGYFPGTRFSDDLDFSTNQGLDSDHVLTQLNRVCDFAGQATGIPFDIGRNRLAGQQQIDAQKHVYKYKLYFKDMLAGRDSITISVRVDVTEYDRLLLEPQMRKLIHPYSDADACVTDIRCVKLEEALADKLKCLLQRRYCYDLFDLVYGAFISKDIDVDRTQLMRVFLQKTTFGASPSAARSLLLDLPLDLFRGYWGKVIVPAASRLTFDHAVDLLKSGVTELFAPYANQRGELAFYPSQLRNLILQAGWDRKLMRLTYDGVTRIVEPYSLVFKRTQSGQASEYLYVYDRTGGRSSGPGIKSFFHHKIQGLTVLEETFDPRFEMTLAKAGDVGQSGSFTGSPGRRAGRSTTVRRARTTFGPTYVIQCGYCSKQFRRKKNSTTLGKHNNPWGSPCHGRRGYLVSVR